MVHAGAYTGVHAGVHAGVHVGAGACILAQQEDGVECPLSLSANSFEVGYLPEPGAHLFLGGWDAGKP